MFDNLINNIEDRILFSSNHYYRLFILFMGIE